MTNPLHKKPDAQSLRELAVPVLHGLGYDVVDLEWKHEAGSWVMRVYIDFATTEESLAAAASAKAAPPVIVDGEALAVAVNSRISHEDCTRASRALSAELDVADAIQVPFHLEISSPGLNRPLTREIDFRRFAGRKAKVRTRAALTGTVTGDSPAGRRNFAGRILGTDGGRVRLDVDGRAYEIPVADVEKANLIFEPGEV